MVALCNLIEMYELSKKQAQMIADKLSQKDNTRNVRTVTCSSGYSVKFDIEVEGMLAEGAQIHRDRRSVPKTTGD